MTKIVSGGVAFANPARVRARGSEMEHVRAEAQLSERARLTIIVALPHASRFHLSAAAMTAAGAIAQEAAGVLRAVVGDSAFAHRKPAPDVRCLGRHGLPSL